MVRTCGFPDEPCSTCEATDTEPCACHTDFTCLAHHHHQDVGPGDADGTREPVAGADTNICDVCKRDGSRDHTVCFPERRVRLVELRISPCTSCGCANGGVGCRRAPGVLPGQHW